MLVVALCTASNSGSRVHSMKGGAKVIIEPHRHPGVFVARGKEDALVTLNMVPGKTVYGEKTVKVDDAEGKKVEYRVWNPFRSKLAAAILGGVDQIAITDTAAVTMASPPCRPPSVSNFILST